MNEAVGIFIALFILLTMCIVCECENKTANFCSFFKNRKPTPQPSLRNCTWFKENSCCKQEEIANTFGKVKPLPGSSPECQHYTNYLMCYVCAPYQNAFYVRERLTVCEEFCDAWYSACSSAVLKGAMIGALYTNGKDFCKSRRFEVDRLAYGKCFFFDPSLDDTSGGPTFRVAWNTFIVLLFSHVLCVLFIGGGRS